MRFDQFPASATKVKNIQNSESETISGMTLLLCIHVNDINLYIKYKDKFL